MSALKEVCKLILYLSDLAHYHDEKGSDEYKLVFVAEDIVKGERAITVHPYLDNEILSYEVGTELLDSLQNENLDSNPHLSKERSIFRSSLIEFLSGFSSGEERFKGLISAWPQFRLLYENNLSTYLSGFSFHRAKQEVASAQLAIAEQLSKLVSDISGKILSVPISLAVIIAIPKADTMFERAVLVVGIAITSALLAEMLSAQKSQYERVKHSRGIMFAAHEKKMLQYPEELRRSLVEAVNGLSRNERKLKRSLFTLRVIVWLPAIGAIAVYGQIYYKELQQSLSEGINFISLLFRYIACI